MLLFKTAILNWSWLPVSGINEKVWSISVHFCWLNNSSSVAGSYHLVYAFQAAVDSIRNSRSRGHHDNRYPWIQFFAQAHEDPAPDYFIQRGLWILEKSAD